MPFQLKDMSGLPDRSGGLWDYVLEHGHTAPRLDDISPCVRRVAPVSQEQELRVRQPGLDPERFARIHAAVQASALHYTGHHVREHLETLQVAWSDVGYRLAVQLRDQGRAADDWLRLLQTLWICSRTLLLADRPCFVRPSVGLCQRLLLTDPKVDGAQVRSPFPAFHVFLPRGMFEIVDDDGVHPVAYLSIAAATQRTINETLNGRPASFHSVVVHAWGQGTEADPADLVDMWAPVTLTDDGPVVFESSAMTLRICGQPAPSLEPLARFGVNLLLYLTHTQDLRRDNEAEVEKLSRRVARKPTSALQKRLAAAQAQSVYDTGTEVLFSPDLDEALRAGTGATWTLTYRTLVRGHWRNQACGQGHRDRRLIWIEPHTRGADFADRVAAHTYTTRRHERREEGAS